jgi:hypothetical protein
MTRVSQKGGVSPEDQIAFSGDIGKCTGRRLNEKQEQR